MSVGAIGGQKDILDPHNYFTRTAFVGVHQLFEALIQRDHQFVPRDWLAEEVVYGGPSRLTIRVKQGIEFHNGKTLSADDVIFSIRRIITLPGADARGYASVDLKGMRKLDNRTVRLELKRPDVSLPGKLASNLDMMVPVGFDPKKPVGTGPFKFVSMTPGKKMSFVKNPNYWRKGLPYLDALDVVTLTDDTARVNALLGGQVQAIEAVPAANVPLLQGRSDVQILESKTGQWQPIVMNTSKPPFTDVRVRQAMRLIVDRPQMVAQGLAGHGYVANDIFSPYDSGYNHGLPQRQQDLEKAKSLLAAAGQSNLTVTLTTAQIYGGLIEQAQVFAQQAKGAGVTVNIQQLDPTAFWANWLSYTFAQDFWTNRDYFTTCGLAMAPTAPWNETHWKNPQWAKLYNQALRTVDTAKRNALIRACQKIEYDQGGYIIFAFQNFIDAYSSKFTGLRPDVAQPLGHFGFGEVHLV
jgi:peptide/nickel transport system substrate-binding protein